MKRKMKMLTSSNLWALQAESAQEIFQKFQREYAAKPADALQPASSSPVCEYEVIDSIAVIKIGGVIERTARISWFTGLPYTEGQDRVRTALELALIDPQIKAVLLSINSPGGTAAGTKELADFIAVVSAKKKICAYADGLCASAAYWLASATGTVYAPVTAQVGSIGVIAVLTDWTKAAEKAGFTRTVLYSGQWKAAGSPDKPLTGEERSLFQSQLEKLHSIFKADVANAMGITAPESSWAEGQTILGEEAKALGLVTEIVRDQAEAIALLKASIKEEKIMDLTQLKAGHPQLVEEIRAEAARQAEQEKFKALNEQAAETLALVRLIAGEEIAAKVESVRKSGITAAQLQMLAPLLGGFKTKDEPKKSAEEKARERILAGIANATGAPVTQNTTEPTVKSRLVADAERRSTYTPLPGDYDK